MPTVRNVVTLPGSPLARVEGVLVDIHLVTGSDPAFESTTEATVSGSVTTTTDATGLWSADLISNQDPALVPTGSVFRVTERDLNSRFHHIYFINVPITAGPHWVGDLLTDPPAALASSALQNHLDDTGDAHDASAVSFAPEGSIAATDVQAAIVEISGESGGIHATTHSPGGTDPLTDYAQLGSANVFAAGPQTAKTGAATNRGLIVQAAVAQTANIQEWQDSAGAVRSFVRYDGSAEFVGGGFPAVRAINGASTGEGSALFAQGIQSVFEYGGLGSLRVRQSGGVPYGNPSAQVLVERAVGQTSDFLRVAEGATVLMSLTPAGLIRWNATANEQTTVGAAGAASALPASPTKYLKVVDSAGATLVVPAYAAA